MLKIDLICVVKVFVKNIMVWGLFCFCLFFVNLDFVFVMFVFYEVGDIRYKIEVRFLVLGFLYVFILYLVC